MPVKGRPFAARFDAERQAALVAEIDGVAATLPSVSRRRLLVREAGKLLALCERFDAMTDDVGLLTGEGRLRVAYSREFLGIQARLDRVLRLLGLNDAPDAAEPSKPSVDELIARARVSQEGQ
jgi:hypothetical protein